MPNRAIASQRHRRRRRWSARRAEPGDRLSTTPPAKALERPPCRTGRSPLNDAAGKRWSARRDPGPRARATAGLAATTTIAGSDADVPAARPHRHVRGPAPRPRPARSARRSAPRGRRLHRPTHRRDAVSDAARRGRRRRGPRRCRARRGADQGRRLRRPSTRARARGLRATCCGRSPTPTSGSTGRTPPRTALPHGRAKRAAIARSSDTLRSPGGDGFGGAAPVVS